LRNGHASEKSKFDDPSLPRVELLQTLECLVQCQDVDRTRCYHLCDIVQLNWCLTPTSLGSFPLLGIVNQYSSHDEACN
jgi:hypothetical protein